MRDELPGIAESLGAIEDELRERQTELKRELRTVEADLARVTAARLSLTGDLGRIPSQEGPGSARRRMLATAARENEVMGYAEAHAEEWWTVSELAAAKNSTTHRVSPTVGRLVDLKKLERQDTRPPLYRLAR